MAVSVQLGMTATIQLAFTQGGVPCAAPSTGGSVANGNTNVLQSVALAADQKTVTVVTKGLGSAQITYTGPTGSGISAAETVNVIATVADGVHFDESTLTTS